VRTGEFPLLEFSAIMIRFDQVCVCVCVCVCMCVCVYVCVCIVKEKMKK